MERKSLTEEHRKKLSEALKGKKRSTETRKKISDALTGKKLSEEHKRKISLNNSHYWLGKKRPEMVEIARKYGFQKGHKDFLPSERRKKIARLSGLKNKGRKLPKITGKNHYLWNGNTPLVEQIRKCIEYRQWRSDIFTRDNFICVLCGKKDKVLNADHIKQFSTILFENKISSLEEALKCEELWNLNNGRTLCIPCHREIPVYSYDGKRKINFTKGRN